MGESLAEQGGVVRDVCLHQVNFLRMPTAAFLDVAREVGARSVELHPFDVPDPLTAIAEALSGTELVVQTVNPLPDWFSEGHRPSESAKRLIAAGARLGARYVVAPSPVYFPAEEHPPIAEVAGAFGKLARAAADGGLTAAFEPVGLSIKKPGARGLVGRTDQIGEFLTEAGSATPIVLDSFCLATAGEDLAAFSVSYPVALVQIADYDGSRLARLMPGEGRLPIGLFLQAVQAAGYRGPVAVEVFPLDCGSSPVSFARATLASLAQAVAIEVVK